LGVDIRLDAVKFPQWNCPLFSPGQHTPEWGGQHTPELPGQLTPELGGQYHRILQLPRIEINLQKTTIVFPYKLSSPILVCSNRSLSTYQTAYNSKKG